MKSSSMFFKFFLTFIHHKYSFFSLLVSRYLRSMCKIKRILCSSTLPKVIIKSLFSKGGLSVLFNVFLVSFIFYFSSAHFSFFVISTWLFVVSLKWVDRVVISCSVVNATFLDHLCVDQSVLVLRFPFLWFILSILFIMHRKFYFFINCGQIVWSKMCCVLLSDGAWVCCSFKNKEKLCVSQNQFFDCWLFAGFHVIVIAPGLLNGLFLVVFLKCLFSLFVHFGQIQSEQWSVKSIVYSKLMYFILFTIWFGVNACGIMCCLPVFKINLKRTISYSTFYHQFNKSSNTLNNASFLLFYKSF
jgi:hypothetical protein